MYASNRRVRRASNVCADSVHHIVGLGIDEDLEQLLARLRVVRQRSVGEAESSITIRTADAVENTAAVQGPEAEMADEHGHDGSDGDRRVLRKRFDPTDVELLPRDQRIACSLEIGWAAPDRDDRLVEIVADRPIADDSDRPIRERQLLRVTEKTFDCLSGRTSSQEHESLNL